MTALGLHPSPQGEQAGWRFSLVQNAREHMTPTAPHCSACGATFGIKFEQYACCMCGSSFCSGDFLLSEWITVHHSLSAQFKSGHGVCLGCVLEVWERTDAHLSPPRGVLGRLLKRSREAWKGLRGVVLGRGMNQRPIEITNEDSFEKLNTAKALAVLRHQKDLTLEKLAKDLVLFARIYAISQKRENERSVALTDIYHLVDWIRAHPVIPDWAHGVQWSSIESTPGYLDYVSDVWHIAQAAISWSNPATVAYHVADRALDQVAGRGLGGTAYQMVKDRLGLNINVKAALLSYLAGLVILQLLMNREARKQGQVAAVA